MTRQWRNSQAKPGGEHRGGHLHLLTRPVQALVAPELQRRGGSDTVMNHTFVTTRKCMEFGREYNGTIVPGVLGDSQQTDTALEDARLRGHNNNPYYLHHTAKVAASNVNSQVVSGLASFEQKGLPRLSCC